MNFEKRGFIFKGIFDINPHLVGKKIKNILVEPMENMPSFVKENNVDIAVLTIPKSCAVQVAEQLTTCGIKAIWNFAHIDLNVPDEVLVENVHLSDSLMRLSYNINRLEDNR